VSEAAALVALAASLAAAVAGPRWAPDWAVALLAAAALAVGGVLSGHEASAAVRHLGPTVGFLAALYVCTHLANSSSLVLPVSNLTNLLAFQALSISFVRFGGLMALPWLAALAIEWAVLSRVFRSELPESGQSTAKASAVDVEGRMPLFALGVLGATLVGFGFSSLIGVAPAWFAAAGALVLVARERISLPAVIRSAEPTFLIFVLALGMVVRAAGDHGLSSFVDSLVPHGTALPKLLAIAGISAVVANLLNNLPATLILLPVAAASGPGGVLAMLIGVNVGPNLTYTGSLATLLWRRVVQAHAEATDVVQFTRLGLFTVPPALAACTVCLWLALQVVK
jgi:arsenical pump membrane protein